MKVIIQITTVSNNSSSLLESPDSLDTPDSHDNDCEVHDGSSILSLMDRLQLMLRSFPGFFHLFFILRYFLVALLRIYSFSCLFFAFSCIFYGFIGHGQLLIRQYCRIHFPLDYLKKTSLLPSLLTNRYLKILYISTQIFSPIFLGIPGVWTML